MRSLPTYLGLVLGAAIAGAVSWQAIASTHPLVPTPDELIGISQPTGEQLALMRTVHRTNDTYSLMIFGALSMIAGAPLYMRGLRLPLQIAAIPAAVALGALTGAAMGGIGFYLHDWMPINWDALVRVAVRWMAMLVPTGLAAAVLTIVCHRAWRKTVAMVMGGVIGSVFAALAYALLAAVFLQSENSDSVLPLGVSSRLLVFVLAPLFIWSTIAHQGAARPSLAPAQSLPTDLEAA